MNHAVYVVIVDRKRITDQVCFFARFMIRPDLLFCRSQPLHVLTVQTIIPMRLETTSDLRHIVRLQYPCCRSLQHQFSGRTLTQNDRVFDRIDRIWLRLSVKPNNSRFDRGPFEVNQAKCFSTSGSIHGSVTSVQQKFDSETGPSLSSVLYVFSRSSLYS